jgi:hypothetical protein
MEDCDERRKRRRGDRAGILGVLIKNFYAASQQFLGKIGLI